MVICRIAHLGYNLRLLNVQALSYHASPLLVACNVRFRSNGCMAAIAAYKLDLRLAIDPQHVSVVHTSTIDGAYGNSNADSARSTRTLTRLTKMARWIHLTASRLSPNWFTGERTVREEVPRHEL